MQNEQNSKKGIEKLKILKKLKKKIEIKYYFLQNVVPPYYNCSQN